eukprot:CAMPEP_0180071876 /NCGR_PEP_ID=MMETSP0985-20121206/12397_1 /TAXON_ID=483367 /ORGANISM="non described non described, Strain CCMP 2436" /LENGTH=111 /DNA_ID=CAMNT_0022003171 /DNA_START=704 /DNA_END=1036 /DNA_ORIENTATION=-
MKSPCSRRRWSARLTHASHSAAEIREPVAHTAQSLRAVAEPPGYPSPPGTIPVHAPSSRSGCRYVSSGARAKRARSSGSNVSGVASASTCQPFAIKASPRRRSSSRSQQRS